MKYSSKGREDRNRQTQEQNQKEWASKLGWFMSRTETATSPPQEGEPVGKTDKIHKDFILKKNTPSGIMTCPTFLCTL